jgi:hypothetical protein
VTLDLNFQATLAVTESEVDGLHADPVQGVDFLDAALCHLQHQLLYRCLSSTSKRE